MKKVTLFIILFFVIGKIIAQTPESFNYQVVIRNSSGDLITNQDIGFRLSVLYGTSDGASVYTETQSVMSNDFGVCNLQVGNGTLLSGNMSTIDWSASSYFLKVEIDESGGTNYIHVGTSQLVSVPFAMHAKTASIANAAITAGSLDNDIFYFTDSDTLFAVKDRDGNIVFAVFNDGVKVYVNEGVKGSVGGFAVSGRSPGKATEYDVFNVTPDSARFYVNESTKGSVGGFAVSGRSPGKGIVSEYLHVTPDSTRIYVKEGTKGSVGGFAVSGRSPGKGPVNDYIQVTRDSTRVYIAETTKGSVGGFAVSGRSPGKVGEANDYFNISGNTSAEIIDPSQARILWYPKKEAFLTGRVLVEGPESVGFNSLATGFETKASGDYSQAMGYQSVASGAYSTAIGYQALANDSNSFGFGNYAQALGKNSFAFGDSAIVESEDGYAIGAYAYTSGRGSFAIGSKDRYFSDNFELRTSATGELSMAVGLDADATGNQSVAVGNDAKASGGYAVAIGRSANASADYSLALSYGTVTSSGTQSIAMGGGTASNSFSFAQGLGSIASGYISTAIGPYNEATSSYSLAMGYKGKATGSYATAIGNNVTAQSYSSFVCGYYNIIEGNTATPVASDPLFVIGNGTYITPSNALTVLKNGNLGIGGHPGTTGANVFAIKTGTIPSSSITNGILLYAEGTNAELKVRDGLGNITTLSPHNFSMIKKSEPMAWSFYSQNNTIGYTINVDMLKAIRTIEKLSGEKLVYLQDSKTKEFIEQTKQVSLIDIIEEQKHESEIQKLEIEQLKTENQLLKERLLKIEELLKK